VEEKIIFESSQERSQNSIKMNAKSFNWLGFPTWLEMNIRN
jgi:hypothetical protein